MKSIFSHLLFSMLFLATLLCAEQSSHDIAAKTAELCQYVQEHETYTKNLNKKINNLTNHCIKTRREYHGDGYTEITYINPYASLVDIKNLYEYRQEQKNMKTITQDTIEILLEQGALINDSDASGKSALDYAESYTMYKLLRSHGAHFTTKTFVAKHPWSISLTSFTLCTIAYCLYSSGYFAHDRYIAYAENTHQENSLHNRDAYGRTPIMNYLIEQEKKLLVLREQMYPLQNSSEQEHAFYSQLVLYQKLLNETQAQIQAMIKQGACLAIQDCNGKSLLNHCQTQEIYNDLRAAGAPFEFIPSVYFQKNQCSAICIMTLPVIGCIVGLSHLIDTSLMTDNAFDVWYKKNISHKK